MLDNITGEYWDQPPSVYILTFDLSTQAPSGILLAQAPLYQMAFGRENRIIGVEINQFVDAFLLDATTGVMLDSTRAGTYSSVEWEGANLFITNRAGTRLYRTELSSSPNDVVVIDISTDEISQIDSRDIGSWPSESVFLNATETSLYVGETRFDPNDIQIVLGVYPEQILAATGDDTLAFGASGIYDPVWGSKIQDMPVGYDIMALGENERFLYTFDRSTQQLHVILVAPALPEADLDADGDVDYRDYAMFVPCLDGPGQLVAPECEITDLSDDGKTDLLDFAAFQNYVGQ